MAYSGIFKPRNKRKYEGNAKNIVYRSQWECSYMMKLDSDPDVIKWSSEEVVIPYTDKGSKKLRRYFPDFCVTRKEGSTTQTYIIEIKPAAQVKEPVRGKKTKMRFLKEVMTYGTNMGKWEAAERYCEMKGYKFRILTEKELGVF